jgi:hypothetical protein
MTERAVITTWTFAGRPEQAWSTEPRTLAFAFQLKVANSQNDIHYSSSASLADYFHESRSNISRSRRLGRHPSPPILIHNYPRLQLLTHDGGFPNQDSVKQLVYMLQFTFDPRQYPTLSPAHSRTFDHQLVG